MVRGAIITFLVNYCAFLFSQNLEFSREFEAPKKNIAVEIINNHPSYFYVIRQNKFVHDITIERRAKPSAEIIAFTPLKLDSVNASWFDYENLDYIAFEKDHKLYFLFEKALNTKKTLYLKIIDTTGKSSGFIELASLEKDNATLQFGFTYNKTSNNNILIVASKVSTAGIIRKVALLFSTEKRKVIWTKKLPLENGVTVFSEGFVCNNNDDLLYLQERFTILRYESYPGVLGVEPILRRDSTLLVTWKNASAGPDSRTLDIHGAGHLKQCFIIPQNEMVFISVQGGQWDTIKEEYNQQIVNISIDNRTGTEIYNTNTLYDLRIKEQLTFYDGPLKEAHSKVHVLMKNVISGNYLYTFSERVEQYYFKELLFRKTDLRNGGIVSQKIIPRKTFFFRERTRYKNIAEAMVNVKDEDLKVFLLENPYNLGQRTDDFVYKKFKKETRLNNSNIVSYSLSSDSNFNKKLVFSNSAWDLIPLRYSSDRQSDVVFYLNKTKFEKFAILKPNP